MDTEQLIIIILYITYTTFIYIKRTKRVLTDIIRYENNEFTYIRDYQSRDNKRLFRDRKTDYYRRFHIRRKTCAIRRTNPFEKPELIRTFLFRLYFSTIPKIVILRNETR